MKRPYSGESWDRFKELNRKVTKRLAVTETRAQMNEDKIKKLETDWNGAPKLLGYLPEINSGSVDDLTKAGTYRVTSAVTGLPEANTFVLDVSFSAGTTDYYLRQRLTSYDETAKEYIRFKIQNSTNQWTAWREVVNNKSSIPVNQGGTGWTHGLNSGINIVPGTSDEWSDWFTPTPDGTNVTYYIHNSVPFPTNRHDGDIYTISIEIEVEDFSGTTGQLPMWRLQGTTDGSWVKPNPNPLHGISEKDQDTSVTLISDISNGTRTIVGHSAKYGEYYENEAKAFDIGIRIDSWHTGRFRYRRLKIERGYVEIPQWSPASKDIDTSINLIRGTRDWTSGTKNVFPNYMNGYLTTDGFSTNAAQFFSTYKDDDGFTVLKSVITGQTTALARAYYSSVFKMNPGSIYTISTEVMIEDVIAHDYNIILNWNVLEVSPDGTATRVQYLDVSKAVLGLDKAESGKWYKINYRPTITYEFKPDKTYYMFVSFCNFRNGTISFKKPMVQEGYIGKPVWAPAPTDYSLEPVNDFTTGINLIRNTTGFDTYTNFVSDTIRLGIDGFSKGGPGAEWTYEKDQDGLTIASVEQTGLSESKETYLNGAVVPAKAGDEFTVFVDFMVDDVSELKYTVLRVYGFGNTSASTVENFNPSFTSQITDQGVKSGEWTTLVLHLKVTNTSLNWLMPRIVLQENGSLHFKKLGMFKGRVKHPVWSPATLDVVNNEATTGINLIRQTRDFGSGQAYSKLLNAGGDHLYREDGFALPASDFVTYKDDGHGFKILNIHQSGVSTNTYKQAFASVMYGIHAGDKYTACVDFMVDDVSAWNVKSIGGFRQVTTNNATIVNTNLQSCIYDSDSRRSVGINDLKSGKWYRIIAPLVCAGDQGTEYYAYLYFTLDQNGSVNFKKPMVYEGLIENPEWSASPLDYSSSEVENASPLLLGSISSNNTIPAKADLNSYTKAGTYYCPSSNDAATMTNSPVNIAFKLYVEYPIGKLPSTDVSPYLRQILVTFDASAVIYMRWKTQGSDTWGTWFQTYGNTAVRPVAGGGTGNSRRDYAVANLLSTGTGSSLYKNAEELNALLAPDGSAANGDYYISTIQQGFIRSASEGVIAPFYGLVMKLGGGGQNKQFLFSDNNDRLAYRGHVPGSNTWKAWKEVDFKEDPKPYVPGLYGGFSIAEKFKNEIGSTNIASWLSSKVSKGDFTGLNIGDYVDIACTGATRRYIIAAIDPYYNWGSSTSALMGHHIVMVPQKSWLLDASRDGAYVVNTNYIKWNTTASNSGTQEEPSPYLASNLHKWELEVALKQFPQEWQDAMISRMAYVELRFSSSSSLTSSTGGKWASLGKLWSPAVTEIHGTPAGTSPFTQYATTLFPLFRNEKILYARDPSFWTRDVMENRDNSVMYKFYTGGISFVGADSNNVAAYPCFLIG